MGLLKYWSRVLVGAAAFAVAACGGGPPPPTMVELTMVPAADVNGANPVVVRVYQLKSPAAFEGALYFPLTSDEAGVLGDDLLGKEEFFAIPGEPQFVVSEVDPDARYLGLAVAFSDIDSANWKATVPISPNKTTAVTANIGALTVSLQ